MGHITLHLYICVTTILTEPIYTKTKFYIVQRKEMYIWSTLIDCIWDGLCLFTSKNKAIYNVIYSFDWFQTLEKIIYDL